MALHINIDDLLNGKAVENNCLDYKKGWNPDAIYRTICAFANDFEDTGGGYIIVGVEEENGRAVRPVKGVNSQMIEQIEKEMVGFNNLIQPYYQPRLFIEEVDGKTILIIKVTAGERRPYKVPDQVTAKQKTFNYYIRYNSSCIVPRNEYEEELRALANRVPYDDRGNAAIMIEDISTAILRDHLVAVKSSLANEDMSGDRLWSILDQMDLTEQTPDGRFIRNVAAMMFSEHPEKFFKYTQVEIVIFPEGREQNPNNIIELPIIKGPVPRMIRDTMNALKINVIRKNIRKQKFDEHSLTTFNYPYQALEEAVVNSLYHRDYQEREPVEITIEPNKISILSFSGPNHTISIDAIREGKLLRSRRYRNRRLGEFLKELALTEGRSTGIPTIQDELARNGSPAATIETDEARTYFIIDIPCHPDFKDDILTLNGENGVKDGVKELTERQRNILNVIRENGGISVAEMAQKTTIPTRTIQRELAELQKTGVLTRVGSKKEGYWLVML
ncbi:MAG: putative DNA binding domain-containing protein [Paludibacteraceae bacterium]|nr:putative DNA binding domain-containing protein [Paludibacteraceae bacterium]